MRPGNRISQIGGSGRVERPRLLRGRLGEQPCGVGQEGDPVLPGDDPASPVPARPAAYVDHPRAGELEVPHLDGGEPPRCAVRVTYDVHGTPEIIVVRRLKN